MQPHDASITMDGYLLTVAEDGRTVARRDNRRDAVLPRDDRQVREDPAAETTRPGHDVLIVKPIR